ncbi:MAG: class I SAM-dependent methyltransferase [Dehalococcoidia bacterium]
MPEVDRHYSEPRLAELYDALCDGRAQQSFYLPLIMASQSVLDVGTGTGELLRLARQAGHTGRLTGLDPAEAMLSVARRRSDIEWVQGDLSTATWRDTFELAIMTGHAFQVLLSDDSIRTALAAVRDALTSDGRFVFETRNPLAREWERWNAEAPEYATVDGVTVRVVYEVEKAPGADGLLTFRHTFTSPGWETSDYSVSTLRFLTSDQLHAFVAEAGLRVEAQFGDWDRSPLSETSLEIITVASRA